MGLRMVEQLELDREWVELMMQAKEIGLDVDEVREFLKASVKQKEVI